MVKKAFCTGAEVAEYLRRGYAVVAIAQTSGGVSYCLEKGSEWIRMLGSK